MKELKTFGYGYTRKEWLNEKIVEFSAITESEADIYALKFAVDNDVFIQPYGESKSPNSEPKGSTHNKDPNIGYEVNQK